MLRTYADNRGLDYHRYSDYHMRLMDGGYTVLDVWTTGRYYFLTTDYVAIAPGTIERGGEKGDLPIGGTPLLAWLDKAFFPEGA